ncbi:hypothetical protein [Pseudoalteromonas 'SMAR']|uniref:hypothetical protein n=1 Tax=Pseudoalteromonas 'SMAR' TaxID=3416908 RepID=UPI003AF2154A
MAQQSLSFIVSPGFLPGVGNSQEATPTSSWAITNRQHQDIDKVVIDIADLSGKPVNLYYELDPESVDSGWQFADNGTLFVNAQDNFNYQVSSIVANGGRSMIVSITSIESSKTILESAVQEMAEHLDSGFAIPLHSNDNFQIAYRLIAKHKSDPQMRYFSQDPTIVIEDTEPN